MKILVSALAAASVQVLALALAAPAFAAEPDGLTLPPGFHATVVGDLGNAVRHMAFRDANTLYVSTDRPAKDAPNVGIIAVHLGKDHKIDGTPQHFSTVDNGTSIVFHDGALYAASATTIYRFKFAGKELVPTAAPETIVDAIPRRSAVAFDPKGGMYVAVGGSGNMCVSPDAPKGSIPVGLKPCPDMPTRSGIWRFDGAKTGQKFLEGEHYATGIRDLNAVAWKPGVGLYAVVYGRDATAKNWPDKMSAADELNIADEMFLVGKDTDMGWPYTYWDRAKKQRLMALEYGGDAKTPVTDMQYAVPVATFTAHVAPQDVTFYTASQFPAEYRGGAFIPFHGPGGDDTATNDEGYSVGFVPMDKNGKAGTPKMFADGFAGAKENRNGKKANFRPTGVTVGPDGALYVSDSQKGRIWRITYGK
jgi:glucose/arabinose dehydrogenase